MKTMWWSEKYNNEADASIGRVAREIQQQNDIINNSVIFIDDLNKVKAGFTITCKGNDETMQFREWYHKFKSRIISSFEAILKTKNIYRLDLNWV